MRILFIKKKVDDKLILIIKQLKLIKLNNVEKDKKIELNKEKDKDIVG